jgi:hypothetical protein
VEVGIHVQFGCGRYKRGGIYLPLTRELFFHPPAHGLGKSEVHIVQASTEELARLDLLDLALGNNEATDALGVAVLADTLELIKFVSLASEVEVVKPKAIQSQVVTMDEGVVVHFGLQHSPKLGHIVQVNLGVVTFLAALPK